MTTTTSETVVAKRIKPIATNSISGYRDKAIDRMIEAFLAGERPGDKTLFKIGRSLHDVRVRDVAAWYMSSMGLDELRGAGLMACAVADVMHPDDTDPALTLAALAAWLEGQDALAVILVEGPARNGYTLALLVAKALVSGLPGREWTDTMRDLTYDEVRYGMGQHHD